MMKSPLIKIVFMLLLASALFYAFLYAQTDKETEYIVFSRLTDGFWQLWRINLNDYKEEQLTSSPTDKHNPIWLAEKNAIVYNTTNDEFYLLSMDGKEEERILEDYSYVADPCWLSKGQKIIFVKYRTVMMDSSDIWSANVDGSDKKILTTLPGLQSTPSVSPDETKIAFTSGKGYGTFEIYIMGADGKNITRITNNEAMEIYPRISPDGKYIAYASDISGNYDIWLLNLDNNTEKQLTLDKDFDTYPTWSPDGRQLSFVSNRAGNLQIFTLDLDSGKTEQITFARTDSRGPVLIKIQNE